MRRLGRRHRSDASGAHLECSECRPRTRVTKRLPRFGLTRCRREVRPAPTPGPRRRESLDVSDLSLKIFVRFAPAREGADPCVAPWSNTRAEQTLFHCPPRTFRDAAKRDSVARSRDTFVGGRMRYSWRWPAPFVAAGMGVLLASCSEPTTTSAPLGRPNRPAVSNVVSSFGSPTGTLQTTIRSGDASVHYCGYQPVTLPILTTFSGTDCGDPAANLTVPLTLFTPGDPEWA